MHLKKLSLQGFKSFANRTNLEFEQGITAIVGPNGSGKSNIADAVRWILGEQRIKNLRGSKLEDVVFAGSQGSKPVGMAEVSMVVDNSDGRLNLDYSEVGVSRRVYRSGESEFFINNSPCRLRDIQELFMDTGVGRDAYCVLGQADIDMILSPNSEDRKRFFEEAAGVVKFRVRKAEAQRRLAETETNLTRLDDILHEIKGQLGPLARQANKTERHREYSEALKTNETIIYAAKYQSLQGKLTELKAEVDKLQNAVAGESSKLSTAEAALQEKQFQLATLEQNLEELRLSDLETTRQLEQSNADLRLAEEKYQRWSEELQRAQEALRILQDKTEASTRELQQREEAVSQAKLKLTETASDLQEIEERLKAHRALVEEVRTSLATTEGELFAVLDQINDLRAALTRSQSKGEQAEFEFKRLHTELLSIRQEVETLSAGIQKKKSEETSIRSRLSDLKGEQSRLCAEEKVLQQKVREATTNLDKNKEELHQVHSQFQALKQLDETGEDLFSGVRRVLQEAAAQRLDNLVGVVADLLQVPRGLELAIETALGSNVQCIVAENDLAAEKAITWLKEKKAGRATFLPLNIISGRSLPEPEKERLQKIPGFIGIGSEEVETPADLTNLKTYLLGRTLLAKDLTTARVLARETKYRYQVVTIDGEIIRPGGSITGGHQGKTNHGLLARKGRIKELKERGAQLAREVQRAQEALSQARNNLQENQEKGAELDRQYQKFQLDLVGIEKELVNLEENREGLLKRGKALEARISQLEQEKSKDTLAELEKELARARSAQGQLEDKLESDRARLQRYQDELEQVRGEAAQAETELALKEERYRQKQTELRQVQEEVRSLANQKTANLDQVNLAKNKMQEAHRTREEAEKSREELSAKQRGISHRYKAQREKREALRADVAEGENGLRILRRQLSELTKDLHNQELELTRLQSEVTQVVEKAFENYELRAEDLAEIDLTQVELDQIRSAVSEYQNKLKMLGPINPEAEREYQAARERHDFLQNQYADLVKAKDDLYNVIADIEETTERQFSKAFSEIQREFQELFQRLFGGGDARLKLTQPDDLSETGVEILAQPPGKKLQNLALLSSGERSLTAIALLLAILKVNPAPFTVMDEVDAALDDANLERFGELLVEFSQRTQFIVITHRRRTMEVASVLYGITMQKDQGYSEVVSVKLSDVE